ncbi:terminase gpA endonuclease subunit [Oleidesulfovibrio sp.]|uniref:terminase gpA endonuclease subunit n=1 Tax=Oleidesulfovibrio sp. TaxID=2909707 RepID=UPI003A8A2274
MSQKTQLTLYPESKRNPKQESVRRVVITARVPHWLSAAVSADVAAFASNSTPHIRFCFSKGEKKILRKRKTISVSVWAERYRILEMSSIPGKWKNLFTPYLVGIMDAAGMRGIETVIVCKSPQTGGSESGHNLVGWCIDRSPGPVMYVFPDELTARENARDRIIPMISGSPRLRDYMTSAADDTSSLRINLSHMPIYLGWSGSVSRLGNKPIRTLILDELDKYKNPKNEATSEILAEKRTTTWRNRRHIMKISTPTTEDGPIWRAFKEEAGARFDYWVRCPHCGIRQFMQFDRIDWPHKGDTEKSPSSEEVLAQRLATYPCEHCGAVWDDGDRDRAVRKGEWVERTSGLDLYSHIATYKPVKVGFHIPAWLSYFVSLSEVAAAQLKYDETGKLDDLKNLQNQYKAEPWREEHSMRAEDTILALCDDRPRGAVPAPVIIKDAPTPRVACLLAGVDTQKSHFRYTIRAFGYGDTEESWLVQAGVAPSFTALNEILWNSVYRNAEDTEYKVRACMIDAMGGRTKEVYSWAIRHRGRVYPWQGVRAMAQPYTPSPQEYFPDAKGNKVKIPGGLNLWRCDTTFFKSDLSHKLSIAPQDPGAFHLHTNGEGVLDAYAKEMCAEVWDDEKQAWVNPAGRPNHFWDCEVMSLALAYILNVRHWPKAVKSKPTASPNKPRSGGHSIQDRLARARR